MSVAYSRHWAETKDDVNETGHRGEEMVNVNDGFEKKGNHDAKRLHRDSLE